MMRQRRGRVGTAGQRSWRCALLAALFTALLGACSLQGYHSGTLNEQAGFIARGVSQHQGPVRVTAAVPDAGETRALTGLDLYQQGIQPLWLQVQNNSEHTLRLALASIDPDYFSPIEVAYMNRSRFSAQGYHDMEAWFNRHGMVRSIAPGERRSGLVFTHLTPGTKAFNLDIYASQRAWNFTFFVPLPGFTADYRVVNLDVLYAPAAMQTFDEAGLQRWLEQGAACCATGPDGAGDGGPLNVAVVGTPLAVRRALFRGGWRETQADSADTRQARQHHFQGRAPDTIFLLERGDSNERLQLHLWRAPWNVSGEPGWIGQVVYRRLQSGRVLPGLEEWLGSRGQLSLFAKESVEADVDTAHRFLMQNLWYNQSLKAAGFVGGVGVSDANAPRTTFDGFPYVTEGFRAVLFLSEQPVAMDRTRLLYAPEGWRPEEGRP
ncbi:hypothetical protein [Parahaliea mediterranea]|uniref:hypothetical protein n=1 Tax=Parahaliea mediterranea TaxID=651086 RepID=UPI000E2EC937|nr:hypothetical protein [Parahaliea mediterranea]